ncbi:MAG: UDP-N-acetylmuramate dehydrogenase, partial [Burkholderiales bacterium]|nr:UDP-N-acetylmuramate dehydrogenase [Burkholderiales bacterium]
MLVEKNVPLQPYNTFRIVARAHTLVRVLQEADVSAVLADPVLAPAPKFVLGGGSNIVLTGDVKPVVLKVEIAGRRLVDETPKAWIVEAGGGENWHELVRWTLDQGWPGLENLALIPGTVGAAPVQNIGAYGVELQDRFHSLDAINLETGQAFTLDAAQCGFAYRDSVFKHAANAAVPGFGLAGRALIARVRLALPKAWKPVLGYLDLERKMVETGLRQPTARQIYDWICEIRRAKLPDPAVIGNAGSFFKNP